MSTAPTFPPLGTIVTFQTDKQSLQLGTPVPVRWDHPLDQLITACGKVVEVRPIKPHGPGKVPTAAVTVEGRSKKRLTIDGAGCYLHVWPGWDEAIAACKLANPPPTA